MPVAAAIVVRGALFALLRHALSSLAALGEALADPVARSRPERAPDVIPRWAFRMLIWQAKGRKGKRPLAPRPIPAWYWPWASWKLSPYRIAG